MNKKTISNITLCITMFGYSCMSGYSVYLLYPLASTPRGTVVYTMIVGGFAVYMLIIMDLVYFIMIDDEAN